MNFLESKNFKSRFTTAVLLLVVGIASLFTPNIIGLRVLILLAGTMAILEMALALSQKMKCGLVQDDRPVVMEILIVLFGTGAIVVGLEPVEIILVILAAVANDVFAYFVGNIFHDKVFRSRPFPKVSPNKSWEGIIGGYLGAIIFCFAFLVIYKYIHGLRDLTAMPFGYYELFFIFLAPFFAILGDYTESFAKRYMAIKDSGEVIKETNLPVLGKFEIVMNGHGGFADRLDSCALVACYMFFLKYLTPP